MILSSVLLPQPLWPTIVTNSASATANETSDSACTGPSCDGYTLLRLRTSTVPRGPSSPEDVSITDRRGAGGSLVVRLDCSELQRYTLLLHVPPRESLDIE